MLNKDLAKPTMRILVVDDSQDSRDLTEAALLSAGYRDVATAESAMVAFKALDIAQNPRGGATPYDLILLDIIMPEIDGIEACARIRSDHRYGDIPIIMVTAMADMESLSNAFLAGANDYITKPINRIELLARVRAALKLKAELARRQDRERELLALASNRGGSRPSTCIDGLTGFLVGEVAEAYLASAPERLNGEPLAVIALAVDRLEACRASKGDKTADAILVSVAGAIRSVSAAVGVIAAAYRDGLFVLIAPGYDDTAAMKCAESLQKAVARLALTNAESIKADHVTASLAVSGAFARRGIDYVKLLTQAIHSAQQSAAMGGGKVIAMRA